MLKFMLILEFHALLNIFHANLLEKLNTHKNAAVWIFSLVSGFILISSNNFLHSNGFLIIFEAALNTVHSIINDHMRYAVYAFFNHFVAFWKSFQTFINLITLLAIFTDQNFCAQLIIAQVTQLHTHWVIITVATVMAISFATFHAVFALLSLKLNRQYQTISLYIFAFSHLAQPHLSTKIGANSLRIKLFIPWYLNVSFNTFIVFLWISSASSGLFSRYSIACSLFISSSVFGSFISRYSFSSFSCSWIFSKE